MQGALSMHDVDLQIPRRLHARPASFSRHPYSLVEAHRKVLSLPAPSAMSVRGGPATWLQSKEQKT